MKPTKSKTHSDYRKAFLEQYHELRGQHLSGDLKEKWRLFLPYFSKNYAQHLPAQKNAKILDVGFGEGIFLFWASENGYKNLHGVDPCKAFVEIVNSEIPAAKTLVGTGEDYLAKHQNEFDVIVIKAVLEHIPKSDVFPLIQLMHAALKPGGVLIVDVPNMDWLMASRERYLDFTHEVGFTKESLRDCLAFFFDEVRVHIPEDTSDGSLLQTIIIKFFRPPARWLFKLFLYIVSSDGMSSVPWYARSIIGVAKKNT